MMNYLNGLYNPFSSPSVFSHYNNYLNSNSFNNSQNCNYNSHFFHSMNQLPFNNFASLYPSEKPNKIKENSSKEKPNPSYRHFESSSNLNVNSAKFSRNQIRIKDFPSKEKSMEEKDAHNMPRPCIEICSPISQKNSFPSSVKNLVKNKELPQTHRNYCPMEINYFELKEIKYKSYFCETKEAIYKPNRSKVFLTCINKLDTYDYKKLRSHFYNVLPIVLNNRNENLVKIHSIFEDLSSFYICSDVPLGENLLYSLDNIHLSEIELRNLTHVLIEIIENKLSKKLLCPKISLENIFYSKSNFRLYDYGKFLLDDQFTEFSHCLSGLIYQSPQFLKTKNQTEFSELWRIGIILIILVFGRIPFQFSSNEELKNKITNFNNNIVLEDEYLKNYSSSFCDFLKSLFNNNEEFTLEKARNHPWFTIDEINLKSQNLINNNILLPNSKKTLKSTIIFQTFLVNYLKYNNLIYKVLEILRTSFSNYDLKQNGTIEKNLCQKIISSIIPSFSLTALEISTIFDKIESDDEFLVDYTQVFSKIVNFSLKYFEDRFERLFLCLKNERGDILKEKLNPILQVNDELNIPYFKIITDEFCEEKVIKYIDFLNIIHSNYRTKATKIIL